MIKNINHSNIFIIINYNLILINFYLKINLHILNNQPQ